MTDQDSSGRLYGSACWLYLDREGEFEMWIFLLDIAGVILSLGGWFGLHSFWLLLAGIILTGLFDCLMSSSGGQLKSFKLSVISVVIGAITEGVLQGGIPGILAGAMLGFAVYSALLVVFKLILLFIGMLDKE